MVTMCSPRSVTILTVLAFLCIGGSAAHALTQALAPDVPAITELRAWLATRLGWRPPG